MMKNECEIVKDLLTNYHEGIVSSSTKEFVEKHLENCVKCKEMLTMIEEDEKKEEEKEKTKEKFEIKYLLKLKRSSLKSTIIASLVLLLVLGTFIIQPLCTKKIATDVYDKIQTIETGDNFKVVITRKNYANNEEYEEGFYYKDGKYKSEDYLTVRTSFFYLW